VKAVNADERHGKWVYAIARKPTEVGKLIESALLINWRDHFEE